MKEQTKSFPRQPIEIPVEPSPEMQHICYREIDLAIKVKEYLIVLECKGTSAPIQELGDYIKWASRFYDNLSNLKLKIDIMHENVQKGVITHNFFKGVKTFIPYIIQTEGIFVNIALFLIIFL